MNFLKLQSTLYAADAELSAIAAGRLPSDKEKLLKIVDSLRKSQSELTQHQAFFQEIDHDPRR